MPRTFRTSAATRHESYNGQHRFEHCYRDNTVYFITARCRDRFPAFDTEEAKLIFWDRFYHWSEAFGFIPWIVTLLNNHCHVLGYLCVGDNLGPLMQRLHGSVAKLVNDTLPARHLPFWRRAGNQDYFDGCIRDVLQLRRAYHYTLMQAVRAGLVRNPCEYPHTRIHVDVENAVARATELNAFLEKVPYAHYDRARKRRQQRDRDDRGDRGR